MDVSSSPSPTGIRRLLKHRDDFATERQSPKHSLSHSWVLYEKRVLVFVCRDCLKGKIPLYPNSQFIELVKTLVRAQELCEVEVAVLGFLSLISLIVSVDVKQR